MAEPKRLWWVIEGRSGTKTLFREAVTIGQLSEDAVIKLLQCLASKHLDPKEILASSVRRSAKARISLLNVECQRDERRALYYIGDDPHYLVHTCTDYQMQDLDEDLYRRLTSKRTKRARFIA